MTKQALKIIFEPKDGYIIKAAAAAEEILCINGSAVVELLFVKAEEIKQINRENRNKDAVTDVLSFPYFNFFAGEKLKPFNKKNFSSHYDNALNGVLIGSIVICSDIAKAQAIEFNHSLERENTYLFTHGLLHILGYDHETQEDKSKMRKIEEEILSKTGLEI